MGSLAAVIVAPAPALTSNSKWGARAVEALDEINCYAVVVGSADLASQTCTNSDETTFNYGLASGFVGPTSTLSLDVPAGSGRVIRVLGTAVAPGKSCPKAGALDAMQLAQLRVVGEATVDLKSGTTTAVDILMNMSGKAVESCTGALASTASLGSYTCNSKRADVVANPSNYISNKAVVILKRGVTGAEYISSLTPAIAPRPGSPPTIVGSWDPIYTHLVSLPTSPSLAEDLDYLCSSSLISAVEPVAVGGVPALYFNPTTQPILRSYPPTIASLNTGLELGHSAITGSFSYWTNTSEIPGNGIDDDDNSLVDDENGWNFITNDADVEDDEGLGTSTAGAMLLGAGVDITAPSSSGIKIMPIKTIDSSGTGTEWDVVNGVLYAVHSGVSVIYLGFGGSGRNLAIERALAYAAEKEIVVVAAAGNSGTNNDLFPLYPASYVNPLMLSVASITDFDVLSSFSNFGPSSVHLAARGLRL